MIINGSEYNFRIMNRTMHKTRNDIRVWFPSHFNDLIFNENIGMFETISHENSSVITNRKYVLVMIPFINSFFPYVRIIASDAKNIALAGIGNPLKLSL